MFKTIALFSVPAFFLTATTAFSHSSQECKNEVRNVEYICNVTPAKWFCDATRESALQTCERSDHPHQGEFDGEEPNPMMDKW